MAHILELPVAVQNHAVLLLDTCILIDEFKRGSQLLAHPVGWRVSIVSLYEFLRGPPERQISREERQERTAWLDEKRIVRWPLSSGSLDALQNLVRTDGCPPGLGDTLLAAECVSRKIPLVTRNIPDFDGVDELILVSVSPSTRRLAP